VLGRACGVVLGRVLGLVLQWVWGVMLGRAWGIVLVMVLGKVSAMALGLKKVRVIHAQCETQKQSDWMPQTHWQVQLLLLLLPRVMTAPEVRLATLWWLCWSDWQRL